MTRFFTCILAVWSFSGIAQIPDYVPADGLVAWWGFNGSPQDESGSENHGTVSGAVLCPDRFGNDAQAYSFDGTSLINAGALPNLGAVPEDMTQSGWFKTSNDSFCKMPLMTRRQSTGGMGWPTVMFRYDDTGFLNYFVDDHMHYNPLGVNSPLSTAPVELNDGEWHHFAAVKSGATYTLYVDGIVAGSGTDSHSFSGSTLDFTIGYEGAFGFACERYFTGELDDLGIWNRVLSLEEILALNLSVPPHSGCTDDSACNFDEEATTDDGSCIPSGCMDPGACNYDSFAQCEGQTCTYACCPGPGCCHSSTVWDWELGQCVSANTADINNDGCVQLSDLLDLLSAFGYCEPEEAPWACGDPLSYQGYDYATVQIGDQCWFAENLRAESYQNGDVIEANLSSNEWASATSGAVSAYAESSSDTQNGSDDAIINVLAYGRLYNFWAVSDERGLCPSGWHVANDIEYTTLELFAGMDSSLVEETDWRGDHGLALLSNLSLSDSNWNGTNATGFSGIPGGLRYLDGLYYQEGMEGFWWTGDGWRRIMDGGAEVLRTAIGDVDLNEIHGYSVRCLENAE